MKSNIDPETAIKKIDDFASHIDMLTNKHPLLGEVQKTEVEIRIKRFVRSTFEDGEIRVQQLDSDLQSHKIPNPDTETKKEHNYASGLFILKSHIMGYKDELEMIVSSEKKIKQKKVKSVVTENAKKNDKEKEPQSPAQIRVYGIIGIVIAVVTGVSTINTYPNLMSVAIFGIFTLIFGILGLGCIIRPETFGETLFLLLKQIGEKRDRENAGVRQKQKNPNNSPQVINQGNGTVNVNVGRASKRVDNDDDE